MRESFEKPGHLGHIRRVHTNRKRPHCDVCHQTFFDPRNLRRHMDDVHGPKERPRFPCTLPGCEKTYLKQRYLSQHVKTEHSENPVKFPCPLCGKEFKLRSNLEGHIFTHTTEKPFNCNTCGRSFAQMGAMKLHELNKST